MTLVKQSQGLDPGDCLRCRLMAGDMDGDGRSELIAGNVSRWCRRHLPAGQRRHLDPARGLLSGRARRGRRQWRRQGRPAADGWGQVRHRVLDGTWSRICSESVTTPLGGKTTVTYTPSTAWVNGNLPFVRQTVTRIAQGRAA